MIQQLILNGLIAGSIYILIGLGFVLIYSASRFFHFAHGMIFTAGAYFVYLFFMKLEISLFLAVPLAIILCAVLGCAMDLGVYRILREKRASPLILLLSSLGLYIIVQNIISMCFGDDIKTIQFGKVKEGLLIFGARITPVQILNLVLSITLCFLVMAILRWTKYGKAIKSLTSDWELSYITGIPCNQVTLIVFAIGSGLAAAGGILLAMDIGMTPSMGMNALMMGVVAAIIGGMGKIQGLIFGALLLGLSQHLATWYIGSEWQDAIAFIILLAFLIIRPQGFFGRKAKKAMA